ncbi:MAG: hypothetical protein EPN85_11855 [Bacteroidetes bacterium]|nr:MAG: hypothetical protein EPN85_11855 [Bacteroidota bacterium]
MRRLIRDIAPYAVDTTLLNLHIEDTIPTEILRVRNEAIMYTSLNAIKELDLSVTALQNAPAGVSGTGATNFLTKWQNANTVTTSSVFDNGTNVGIGTNTPNNLFQVAGLINFDDVKLNTALGKSALQSNTSGTQNTAIGFEALFANTIGNSNIAIGFLALKQNTEGKRNIAVGHSALFANTTADRNVAIGNNALSNQSFDNFGFTYTSGNVAIGSSALSNNNPTSIGDGVQNTAVGTSSLENNSRGYENTAIGYHSMFSNVTGSDNTAIGKSADVSAGNLTNAAAIGANAIVNVSNKIRLGNTSVTVIEGSPAAYTSSSDVRFKNNIQEDVKGLEFIEKLRPVTFNVNARKFDEFLMKNMPDSIKDAYMNGIDYAASAGILHSGFIGQEVEQAALDCGYAFDGIHIPADTAQGNYSLSYSQFVVPLVKAMQQQIKKDSIQQAQIDALTSLLAQCCSANVKTTGSAIPSSSETLASGAMLFQNRPNPYTNETSIRYFVPENSMAVMTFFDEFGNEIKSVELPFKGITADLNLSTTDLAAGIYSYSLVVNGKIAETKRMLKTK